MKAELTRNIIDKHVPKTLFKGEHENFELQHVYAELDRIEDNAEKWSEKETPFTITDSDGIFGTCKCNYVVSYPQIYCHNCGQKLDWSEK